MDAHGVGTAEGRRKGCVRGCVYEFEQHMVKKASKKFAQGVVHFDYDMITSDRTDNISRVVIVAMCECEWSWKLL